MVKLLDVVDTHTRLLQMGCMAASGGLGGFGLAVLDSTWLPRPLAYVIIALGVILLVVSAGIKQRWVIEYRGHEIRFENSPVTGERLYLDGGLVSRGSNRDQDGDSGSNPRG